MSVDEFLNRALKDASEALKSKSSSDKNPWREALDVWRGFYAAVDWSETWLRALLVAHAALFVVIIATRRSERTQGVLLCVCAAVVFAAERINAFDGARWESFSGQNYFDSRGRFTSVVLSTPLLIAACVVLVNMLLIMTKLMVDVAQRRGRGGSLKKTQ